MWPCGLIAFYPPHYTYSTCTSTESSWVQHTFNSSIKLIFNSSNYSQYFVRTPGLQRQNFKPVRLLSPAGGRNILVDATAQLALAQYLGKGNEVQLRLYKTAACRESGIDWWRGARNSSPQKPGLKETSHRVPTGMDTISILIV